jgi:hypothetical protein
VLCTALLTICFQPPCQYCTLAEHCGATSGLLTPLYWLKSVTALTASSAAMALALPSAQPSLKPARWWLCKKIENHAGNRLTYYVPDGGSETNGGPKKGVKHRWTSTPKIQMATLIKCQLVSRVIDCQSSGNKDAACNIPKRLL